jgi:hypothetical protein
MPEWGFSFFSAKNIIILTIITNAVFPRVSVLTFDSLKAQINGYPQPSAPVAGIERMSRKMWIDGVDGQGRMVRFTVPSFQEQGDASNGKVQTLRDSDVTDAAPRGVL